VLFILWLLLRSGGGMVGRETCCARPTITSPSVTELTQTSTTVAATTTVPSTTEIAPTSATVHHLSVLPMNGDDTVSPLSSPTGGAGSSVYVPLPRSPLGLSEETTTGGATSAFVNGIYIHSLVFHHDPDETSTITSNGHSHHYGRANGVSKSVATVADETASVKGDLPLVERMKEVLRLLIEYDMRHLLAFCAAITGVAAVSHSIFRNKSKLNDGITHVYVLVVVRHGSMVPLCYW
jgi:hypothetical protein